MNRALKYGAVLIGGYLAVVYWTGFGKGISAGADGIVQITKGFQGR